MAATSTGSMRAIVLDAPGPAETLTIRRLPVPRPAAGWVLIAVRAFGLNRSELHTRLGLALGVTLPRVLGIEAAGTVAACPRGEFRVGQQVATLMAAWAGLSTAVTPNTPVCPPARWCPSPAAWTGPHWARYPRCCKRLTARSRSVWMPNRGSPFSFAAAPPRWA